MLPPPPVVAQIPEPDSPDLCREPRGLGRGAWRLGRGAQRAGSRAGGRPGRGRVPPSPAAVCTALSKVCKLDHWDLPSVRFEETSSISSQTSTRDHSNMFFYRCRTHATSNFILKTGIFVEIAASVPGIVPPSQPPRQVRGARPGARERAPPRLGGSAARPRASWLTAQQSVNCRLTAQQFL